MKTSAIAAALILTVAAAPATAKDKTDTRVQTVLGCSAIADGQQRLACYDSAIAGFRQALAAGQLIAASESERPYALEGIVKAAGPMGFNHYWVVMNTGDRWDVTAYGNHDDVPRKGAKVKFSKGAFSGFLFREHNTPDRRAKYLGRD